MTTHTPQLSACEDYTELRFHEQHKSLMVMIDGNLGEYGRVAALREWSKRGED